MRLNPAQRITNLSIKTQVFVMGRHLENRHPNLRSLGHRGLVDGGGEKRDVVVDIWGGEAKSQQICHSPTASLHVQVCEKKQQFNERKLFSSLGEMINIKRHIKIC